MKSVFVGNLPWTTTEEELKNEFEKVSSVSAVRIISDRTTGKSRGFGFVEVEDSDLEKAIGLNGTTLGSRELVVNEAKARK